MNEQECMSEIEQLTQRYAAERAMLSGKVKGLEEEIARLKAHALPAIKKAAARTAEAEAKLRAAVETAPHLFKRPKTRVIHGVRIGWIKKRGKVVIDDEAAVIARIRRLLSEEQAELLIRVRESVDRNAVGDLSAADLKRLGIRITDDEEQVLVKPVDSEIAKLVDAILKEIARIDEGEK